MSAINSSNTQQNLVLFIHEQSVPCQKVKQLLPKDKNIQIIDISRVNNIPSQITSIPALLIDNKEIIQGKKVFDFFNKSDEMEYLNFGSKGSSSNFGFSSLDDDSIESGSGFSSIDAQDMSVGVPKWEEEENKTLDIDKLQAERASQFKSISRE